MRDRIGRRPRQQIDLADREPLAQLQYPGGRQHILAGLAFAQEVDVEIGGHGKPDRAISVGPDTVPPGRSIRSL